jgi:PPOX class probable F420-dependent enzyme
MDTLTPEVAARLGDATVIWLTTVSPQGQPQASPVWFLWQDGRFLVYSLAESPRVRNLRANPRVALNLDGDGRGGAVVTIEGTADLQPDGPPSTEVPAYLDKYRPLIAEYGWTPESFARDYPLRIVITPTRLRSY